MEITKDRLMKGKPTIIKGKEFLATKDYVEPFFTEMEKYTNEFIINVQEPDQIVLGNDEDNEQITFNKVWIQAVMKNDSDSDIKEVYNFVYGLDVRTPVYKLYRSYVYDNVPIMFEHLISKEIIPESVISYSIEDLMSETSDIKIKIDKMKKSFIDNDMKYNVLGSLIVKALLIEYKGIGGKVKLPTNVVIKAFENVYMDSTSNTYVKDTEKSSIWNFYCSLAGLIKDASKKDIINNFEKTILVEKLLKLN